MSGVLMPPSWSSAWYLRKGVFDTVAQAAP